MTEEQKKISQKNRYLLRKKLGILGKSNLVLHHKDITMKYNNIERYILWLPEDLTGMTRSEHSSYHNKGNQANKGKKFGAMSKAHKAKISASERGKKLSDETKSKISAAHKGKHSPTRGKHWRLENGKRVYY